MLTSIILALKQPNPHYITQGEATHLLVGSGQLNLDKRKPIERGTCGTDSRDRDAGQQSAGERRSLKRHMQSLSLERDRVQLTQIRKQTNHQSQNQSLPTSAAISCAGVSKVPTSCTQKARNLHNPPLHR